MPARKKQDSAITLPQMNVQTLEIPIVGLSPLICHRRSEKQAQAILDKQTKKAKGAKEAREPDVEFQDSLYKMGDKYYGFPASAFKKAAISACRYVDGIAMTVASGAFHVMGDLVKLEASKPVMRQDWVTLGSGVADLRFRAMFEQWSCKILVRFNADAISAEQLVNLFDIAGFGVGVGDWRPEKKGSFGQFQVARNGNKQST